MKTIEEYIKAERDLSNAYLRLRHLIPGALLTPTAPTPQQIWNTTEKALEEVLLRLYNAEKAIEDIRKALP